MSESGKTRIDCVSHERDVVRISQSVEINVSDCCPECKYGPLTGTTGLKKGSKKDVYGDKKPNDYLPPLEPKSGDPTICAKCGTLLMYDKIENRLIIRRPTDAEIDELKEDKKQWSFLQELINKMQEAYKKYGTAIPSKQNHFNRVF